MVAVAELRRFGCAELAIFREVIRAARGVGCAELAIFREVIHAARGAGYAESAMPKIAICAESAIPPPVIHAELAIDSYIRLILSSYRREHSQLCVAAPLRPVGSPRKGAHEGETAHRLGTHRPSAI
jgi:hypothetical protein